MPLGRDAERPDVRHGQRDPSWRNPPPRGRVDDVADAGKYPMVMPTPPGPTPAFWCHVGLSTGLSTSPSA
eukprot:11160596-Lingulodinium_polyedra.AAC.1